MDLSDLPILRQSERAAFKALETNSTEYHRVKARIKAKRGKAELYPCIGCSKEGKNVWAWQHGLDPRDIFSYESMCYSCHGKYDMTDEWRESNRRIATGRRHSDEFKERISERMRGNKIGLGNTNSCGEKSGNAKLTWDKVNEIRRLYELELNTRRELAEMFGVTKKTIHQVVNGHTWKEVVA